MGYGDTTLGGPQKAFPQTVWEVVEQARHDSIPVRRAGLEELCRRYWKPVYSYLRLGWAKSNEDAKDLTQAFFLWAFEGNEFRSYDRDHASFRTYLKSLLKHFVQHGEEAARRLKRGGGIRILELDAGVPSPDELQADPQLSNPEEAFDRAWQSALVARVVGRVRERLTATGREIRFRVFEAYDLVAPQERPSYGEVARALGIRETDVRNHLFAVREEIRAEIRTELAAMAGDGAEVDGEWNAFLT